MLKLLKELVEQDSTTHNLEGVQKVQKTLGDSLIKLGFETYFVPCVHQKYADMLVATLPGESSDFITFIGHADTVVGPEDNYQFLIDEKKKRVTGPGVADDKAGLVVLLEGLSRFLTQHPKPSLSLRVVVSPSEEEGSTSFISFYKEMAKDTKLVLGFEPSLPGGDIIDSRRGNRWYHVKVKGRSAHAGRSKGEHINAAHLAAEKIIELKRLHSPKNEVSVNVGDIRGGQGLYNIICGDLEFKLDTRFSNQKSAQKLRKKIQKLLLEKRVLSEDKSVKSKIWFDVADDCPAFSSSRAVKKYSNFYCKQIKSLEGKKIKSKKSGGAGDVSHFSKNKKVIILDGLGAVSENIHTHQEWISTDSLETRSEALSRLLEFANREIRTS